MVKWNKTGHICEAPSPGTRHAAGAVFRLEEQRERADPGWWGRQLHHLERQVKVFHHSGEALCPLWVPSSCDLKELHFPGLSEGWLCGRTPSFFGDRKGMGKRDFPVGALQESRILKPQQRGGQEKTQGGCAGASWERASAGHCPAGQGQSPGQQRAAGWGSRGGIFLRAA